MWIKFWNSFHATNCLRERHQRNDLDWLGNYRTNSVNKKISWNCKSYKTFESGPKTKCNRFCRWVGWIGCAITRPTTWTRKYHTTQNLTKLWRFWNSSHARDCCVGLSMIDGSGTTWTGWGITETLGKSVGKTGYKSPLNLRFVLQIGFNSRND